MPTGSEDDEMNKALWVITAMLLLLAVLAVAGVIHPSH